ncbi:hypothetical protein HRV87_009055 [Staphylococcus agnetis]|nr:hypothetical protein [Staphylococcus agnetis]
MLMMRPSEWRDWIIGSQEKYLDQRMLGVEAAQANGLVQAGKPLKRITKDIEKQRYEIHEPGSYKRIQQARLAEEKRKRELFKEGTRRWLEQKGG